MVKIIISHVTNGYTATGNVNTGAISLAAKKVYFLAVRNGGGSPPPNPVVAGPTRTWLQIATMVDAANQRRMSIYASVSDVATNEAISISASGLTATGWGVDEVSNAHNSRLNLEQIKVQQNGGSGSGTSTGITITLPNAFSHINNATYGVLSRNGGVEFTPGSGFTKLFYNSSAFMGSMWKDSNDTTVDWTWPSDASVRWGMAIEIKWKKPIGNFLSFL